MKTKINFPNRELDFNQIEFGLPTQIGDLSQLQHLYFPFLFFLLFSFLSHFFSFLFSFSFHFRTLQGNLLIDEIPTQIGRLTLLTKLYFSFSFLFYFLFFFSPLEYAGILEVTDCKSKFPVKLENFLNYYFCMFYF